MSNHDSAQQPDDPLNILKRFTGARIGLGRTGVSLPVKAHLEFQLAHALARDAVNIPLDFQGLAGHLTARGVASICLQSRVATHQQYLQRPDLGRQLNHQSITALQAHAAAGPAPDMAVVIADGLSSKAIERHAVNFLDLLIPALQQDGFHLSPCCLVKYARVAIGDPVGELLDASISIVLIGERPGLSSADSMGIYFTYQPIIGNTDAQRNCISNIHKTGLSYADAMRKLLFLIREASRLKLSGIHLKDQTTEHSAGHMAEGPGNFLLK